MPVSISIDIALAGGINIQVAEQGSDGDPIADINRSVSRNLGAGFWSGSPPTSPAPPMVAIAS